jgi:DNA end-binding protein Ku
MAHELQPFNRKQRTIAYALRKSIGGAAATATEAPKMSNKKPRKAAAGQKEMLMPIAGKKQAKETAAKKPAAKPQRKSA